jgi:hypothetical protein
MNDKIFIMSLFLYITFSVSYFAYFCKLSVQQVIKVLFYILILLVILGFGIGFNEKITIIIITLFGSILVIFFLRKKWEQLK